MPLYDPSATSSGDENTNPKKYMRRAFTHPENIEIIFGISSLDYLTYFLAGLLFGCYTFPSGRENSHSFYYTEILQDETDISLCRLEIYFYDIMSSFFKIQS